jgi:hypothetical protein
MSSYTGALLRTSPVSLDKYVHIGAKTANNAGCAPKCNVQLATNTRLGLSGMQFVKQHDGKNSDEFRVSKELEYKKTLTLKDVIRLKEIIAVTTNCRNQNRQSP